MKTIEQYALDNCPNVENESNFIDGFISGAAFAQRWIPVNEESPGEYEWVIAKSNHGDHYIVNYSFNTYHINMPFEVEITHWRPIELK